MKSNTYGGAGGIRTLGTGLRPYAGLANQCLQPLGHSSLPGKCLEEAGGPVNRFFGRFQGAIGLLFAPLPSVRGGRYLGLSRRLPSRCRWPTASLPVPAGWALRVPKDLSSSEFVCGVGLVLTGGGVGRRRGALYLWERQNELRTGLGQGLRLVAEVARPLQSIVKVEKARRPCHSPSPSPHDEGKHGNPDPARFLEGYNFPVTFFKCYSMQKVRPKSGAR